MSQIRTWVRQGFKVAADGTGKISESQRSAERAHKVKGEPELRRLLALSRALPVILCQFRRVSLAR